MINIKKPHFVIKNRFQKKSDLYSDILTPETLKDVCERVTGCKEYTCKFDNAGYNIGRLATIEYQKTITYISFSEKEYGSRNASFQSFPSALVRYHQEKNTNKRICFYFLPSSGNYETSYFHFMYRLMKTAGVEFLNEKDFLKKEIVPFATVDDIINNRDINRDRNRGNLSTYLTRGPDGTVQIYGKTYGANKKETTLLCIALSMIADTQIVLYQISEQNLSILPKPDLETIKALGNIEIHAIDLKMEQDEFEKDDSLRSPTYTYNLFEKLGNKKCAFCECEISQLIDGAHIWPVTDIKRESTLSQEEKLQHAIDSDNGIWLCRNHHKMLDICLLIITEKGQVKFKLNLKANSEKYIKDTTPTSQLPKKVVTPKFIEYLRKRNNIFEESRYAVLR